MACSDVAASTSDNKLNVVYFGAEEGPMHEAFIALAKETETASFFHAPAECTAAHGAAENGVALFRAFDESPVQYAGAAEVGAMREWFKAGSLPTLIDFGEDYIEPIFGAGREALIFFSDEKDSAAHAAYAEAAKALKGEVLFVQSGTQEGIQAKLAEFVGVDAAAAPTVRYLVPAQDMAKFAFTSSDISTDALKTFIADVKAGKVKAHLKSEAVPAEQGSGAYVVVGDSFNDVVLDPSKDVLVKYYAPWCGHCKKLAPVWDELAESYSEVNDLVIAKFDATANEVAGLQIRGYPTLKWYPKGDKSGIDYDGGRELDDFKSFLAEHSDALKSHKPVEHNPEL